MPVKTLAMRRLNGQKRSFYCDDGIHHCNIDFYPAELVEKIITDLSDQVLEGRKKWNSLFDQFKAKRKELRDDRHAAIAELHALQDKMCEDVFYGVTPSHIACPPLRNAAYITNKTRRNYFLALARAAETGRRFWAKEGIFALREGRKKDSEKAYKMELRRSRQVRVFTEKAMEVKI